MATLIRFEFPDEQERNEFLLLNDLHLTSERTNELVKPTTTVHRIVDMYGNRVGQSDEEGAAWRISILPEYRSSVRSTNWWRAG